MDYVVFLLINLAMIPAIWRMLKLAHERNYASSIQRAELEHQCDLLNQSSRSQTQIKCNCPLNAVAKSKVEMTV